MPRSKIDPPRPLPALAQTGKKIQDLEDVRGKLLELAKQFGIEMKGVSIPQTRTPVQAAQRFELIGNINQLANTLNELSMSEGSQSTATTALHCLFILNDKVNNLLLQNAELHKRVKDLENEKSSVRSGENHEAAAGNNSSTSSTK